MSDPRIPLLVLLGPTAVGKTALALQLATALDGEILSADSRQIYRFMDIGTAKPSRDEQRMVPHHLIDIANPDETLSAVGVVSLARALIPQIHARGRLPMLVGGTGQYITALVSGWDAPPVPPNPALRAALEAQAEAGGATALHARLAEQDPDAAAAIDPRNLRRVIRALEVISATGRPFSQQRQHRPPPYRIRLLGLNMERSHLYARADRRLEDMMRAGFVEEVHSLLARGYSRDLPSMSALGYQQLAAHILDGLPLERALAEVRSGTHKFIRHQDTWFRGQLSDILWLDSETLDPRAVLRDCRTWLQEN